MKTILFSLLVWAGSALTAQNIFPVKVGNCNTRKFCLDCGDIKGGADSLAFAQLIKTMNEKGIGRGVKGEIMLQVLIDSIGNGCVLSHNDINKSAFTTTLIGAMDTFTRYTPAVTKGKPEGMTSVNFTFTIKKDNISGAVARVDKKAFGAGFDHPSAPKYANTQYPYKNEHLKDYEIQSWNKENSSLASNDIRHIVADKNNGVWVENENIIYRFNGRKFESFDQSNSGLPKFMWNINMAVDSNNNKYFGFWDDLYTFNDTVWIKIDSSQITSSNILSCIASADGKEIIVTTFKGLALLKNGKWQILDTHKIPELLSDQIDFAYRDLHQNLWISSDKASIMIDITGKVTNLSSSDSPFKGNKIRCMTEDDNGNLYFNLMGFKRDDVSGSNYVALMVQHPDGTFQIYTAGNSGYPGGAMNDMIYDKGEQVLWMASFTAGLIRFDLSENWEMYNNENSAIPTSNTFQLTQCSDGTIYLATKYGLASIKRK